MPILRFPDLSVNDTADTLAYMAPLSLARELHRLEYFHDVEEETLEAARARYSTQTTADLALTDLLAQPEVVTERNWINVRSYLREVSGSSCSRFRACSVLICRIALTSVRRVLRYRRTRES
jgi:homoserine acetyltransferase